MVDVTEFMLNNGPVAFDKILRAPKPPKTSALGQAFEPTNQTRADQLANLVRIDRTSGRIGGFTGLAATFLSVGSAVKGPSKTKSILRAVGCIGLTFIYMASAEE